MEKTHSTAYTDVSQACQERCATLESLEVMLTVPQTARRRPIRSSQEKCQASTYQHQLLRASLAAIEHKTRVAMLKQMLLDVVGSTGDNL